MTTFTLVMQFPVVFPTPFSDAPTVTLSVTGVELPDLPGGTQYQTFDWQFLYLVEPLQITSRSFSLAYTIHNTGNIVTPAALTVTWLALLF